MLNKLFGAKNSLIIAAAAMVFLLVAKYSSVGSNIDFALQCVIAVIAYLLIAHDVIVKAFKTLIFNRRMSEQFLMMVATFGAFGLRDLPEALAVMLFYKIGELFEEYASGRAHREITALVKLKPSQVRVIAKDGTESIVKPRQVKVGDTVKVLAGEAIGLDGYLLNDSAAVDTSALTGESEPKLYLKGEEVPSGCINTSDVIMLKVSRDHRNSSITRLLNLIEDAAANKSKPEALISRFAVWYTPIVVGAAVILALVPVVFTAERFSDWVTRALVFLVVSCPCALVLSVPLSFFGGIGAISKIGVMVKGSIHIEAMRSLKALAFDKTGTLTKGEFTVNSIEVLSGTKERLLKLALTLENSSTHPVARGIVKYAKDLGITPCAAASIREKSGMGILGEVDGKTIAAGRYELALELSTVKPVRRQNIGTDVYVLEDNQLLGIIELYDDIKDGAVQTINTLKQMRITACLITGDKQSAANAIAKKLGITKVFAEQLPEDKLNNLKALSKEYGSIGFVGDGINDAPVLAASDVGFAMGQFGSASAVEAADVVIMEDKLIKIPAAIKIAVKTYNLAIQNMVFVIAVKMVILILGALGLASIWLAIFGDVGVLILAVLNAMRAMTFARKTV